MSMAVFAAIYTYEESKNEQRLALLDEHRAWLAELKNDCHVLEAGPTAGQPGALLALEFGSLQEATAAFDQDPFYTRGLIDNRIITEWHVKWGVIAAWSAERGKNLEAAV
jgi:uncharacterized protein YciI